MLRTLLAICSSPKGLRLTIFDLEPCEHSFFGAGEFVQLPSGSSLLFGDDRVFPMAS